MEGLTEKVLEFQKTGTGRQELMTALAPRIYRFPRRILGWDDDGCGDFYLWFWPRLERLLSRFKDQGKPFEAYLSSVLHWQLRTYAFKRVQSERSWSTSLRLIPPEEPEDPEDGPHSGPGREVGEAAKDGQGRANGRGVLFLALKCSRFLDPARLEQAARVAGVEPGKLDVMRQALLAARASAAGRLEQLRERRNRAFSQIRLLEEELAAGVDPARAATLHARLQRCRTRLRVTAARMVRVQLDPTNCEIARLLGVPKGTVDSGLYWLKRKLAPDYDPRRERMA